MHCTAVAASDDERTRGEFDSGTAQSARGRRTDEGRVNLTGSMMEAVGEGESWNLT